MKHLTGSLSFFDSCVRSIYRSLTRSISIFLILLLLFSWGCGDMRSIRIQNIAKTDVDMIADMHLAEIIYLMQQFTVKLYKKNPDELDKYPLTTFNRLKKSSHDVTEAMREGNGNDTVHIRRINERRERIIKEKLWQIFHCPISRSFAVLDHKTGSDAMLLAFEEGFQGDRVFAIMFGLYSMVMTAYNNRCELFIMDQLDQQKFYDSARNIEVLAWRLKTRKTEDDKPFLITNEMEGETMNLSFERLMGKMISLQDMMAEIIADSTNRFINKVVHTAGMSFLPIKL